MTLSSPQEKQLFRGRSCIVESWHRFYDPSTGRYISADPIGLAGGINLYAYVGGNPVNFADPLGLLSLADIKKFARDPRVKAISSLGLSLATQLAACNIDPGPLRGTLFAASSGLALYSSAQAAVASGVSYFVGVTDPDFSGISKIFLFGAGTFFGYMSYADYLMAVDYLKAALDEFTEDPSDCVDPCEELQKKVEWLKEKLGGA